MSGLDATDLEQIARTLRTAMAGLGTDETAIYAALSGRNQTQLNEISATYRSLFSRDLHADLLDELTAGELRRLAISGAMAADTVADPASTELSEQLARAVAVQLQAAMSGLGTDETAVYAALTGRTVAERELIRAQYLDLTGRDLLAELRSEFSGSEFIHAKMLFHQGRLQPEDELFLALTGLGTDEATVFRVIESLSGNAAAITDLEARFWTKYSDEIGGLIDALRSDLGVADYERVLRVLGPVLGDIAFEDCDNAAVRAEVRSFQAGARAKVENAIRVLEQGWDGMSEREKRVFNRFFDPTSTGEIDSFFVARVLTNFRLILAEFGHDLTVECEVSAGLCVGSRLYYTYFGNVHVCPYFATAAASTPAEQDRKERDFIHELAHNGMLALDRPYYRGAARGYADEVTPNGPWGTGIPVIGPLIRMIARSDTLYHPDAYSWFAWEL